MSIAMFGVLILVAFFIAMALAFAVGALWGIRAEKSKRHIA